MNQIKLIYKTSPLYPTKLLNIKHPPDILFALGNLKLLKSFSIAIVGARNFEINSKILTQNLSKELSGRDVCIISGMADGIDSIAHESCIKENGKTIAFLGNGFEVSKNRIIFNKILESGGLILSEYFPDIPAFKSNFPRRNELIVALSDGVVAVEAHEKSGTLITGRHALKQKKPLFVFPGNLDNPNFIGNNFLLTNGAVCICSYKDILKKFPYNNFKKKLCTHKKTIPKAYSNIYSKLAKTPLNINKLSIMLDMPLPELQYKLTLMELENLVIKLPNNYYISVI